MLIRPLAVNIAAICYYDGFIVLQLEDKSVRSELSPELTFKISGKVYFSVQPLHLICCCDKLSLSVAKGS